VTRNELRLKKGRKRRRRRGERRRFDVGSGIQV
jgi:hypothetical protein